MAYKKIFYGSIKKCPGSRCASDIDPFGDGSQDFFLKLDDNLNDSQGNYSSSEITFNGSGPNYVSAKYNKGISFSSINTNKISVDLRPSIEVKDFSYNFWFKPDGSPINKGISSLNDHSNSHLCEIFTKNNSTDLYFYYYDGGIHVVSMNTSIQENTWYHLSVNARSSDNTLIIYLNGNLIYNIATNGLPNLANLFFDIGYSMRSYNNDSGNIYFDGIIDEVRVFNRMLTSEEVNFIM